MQSIPIYVDRFAMVYYDIFSVVYWGIGGYDGPSFPMFAAPINALLIYTSTYKLLSK